MKSSNNQIYSPCGPCSSIHNPSKINITYIKKRSLQVLFSEQMKMRAAMQGKEQMASGDQTDQVNQENSRSTEEMKILKAELEKVKLKMQELQIDYTDLQREYGKLNQKQRNSLGWSFGWRKVKNSGIFNRKMDEDETREGRQRANSESRRVSLSRRQSMS